MQVYDNAIVPSAEALPPRRFEDSAGLLWGALGVIAFPLTLPATKIAVRSIDAQVVGLGRALLLLLITRQPLPPRRVWRRLAVVALGVVLGFPLLSALALQSVPSSHAAMVVGLLPAASALLARELGAWQVICWALLLSAPMAAPLVGMRLWRVGFNADALSLVGFAYVSLISMFLGFFAWYRGLALGGIARVGQLQLMQPVLTLLWSHWLLAESVTPMHVITAAAVLVSVGSTLRLRTHGRAHVFRSQADAQ